MPPLYLFNYINNIVEALGLFNFLNANSIIHLDLSDLLSKSKAQGFHFIKSVLLPGNIYKMLCVKRCQRLFEDTGFRLYLVEVLLHVVDVLLHFISILLQLLNQSAQFCGRSTVRQTQEGKRDAVFYNQKLSLFHTSS